MKQKIFRFVFSARQGALGRNERLVRSNGTLCFMKAVCCDSWQKLLATAEEAKETKEKLRVYGRGMPQPIAEVTYHN